MVKKNKLYEQSTDYQLPPGELWWLCTFSYLTMGYTKKSHILFCMPQDAQTWFQANRQAELLIREELREMGMKDLAINRYKVELWEPPITENQLRLERFKQFS